MKIARDITIDHTKHEIRIEGVKFPFYVRADPAVEAATYDHPVNYVTIEILVDNVRVITDDGVQFYDTKGERSAWVAAMVTNIVEERLADTLAWLRANGHNV